MRDTASPLWTWLLLLLVLFSTLTIAVRGQWPAGLFHAGIFFAAIAWMSFAAVTGRRLHAGPAVALLSAPVLAGIQQLAAGYTASRYETLVSVIFWLSMLALAFLLRQWLTSSRHCQILLGLLSASAALSSVYVLLQPYMGGYHLLGLISALTEDTAGPFQNRNTYASFIELALPVTLWYALASRRNGWLFWSAAALMVASVIATASRAGAALVTMEVVMVLTVASRRGMISPLKLIWGGAQLAAGAAIWASLAGWQHLWHRLQFDDPIGFRREIYLSTIDMIAQRPWAGYGMGSFELVYPAFARFDVGKTVNFAHNDWLQWAMEGGVPMAAALAVMALWLIRPALRSVWGIGVLFVLLHSLLDYPMQRTGMACWVIAMIAALEAFEAMARQERCRSAGNADQAEPGLGHRRGIQKVAAVHQ
ncbi:MAG: O-antigen ligase family protein [Acidimicrobiia bacterium]|nr:O-antigen ligase family protein [Acidimicrobiia bacterium]